MIKNEIQILSDVAHVKARPSMYIGSVTNEDKEIFLFGEYKKAQYVPGLIKLIEEITNNSIDEAIRTNFKFANKISLNIDTKTNEVTVEDNGRGIPQTIVTTPEGEEIPGPVAAWTKVRSGGNFSDDENRVTTGMNGVGSSLTNIFSILFTGTTSDGKNELTVNCSNGLDNISWKSKPSKTQGTKVKFIPDFSNFETSGFDETYVQIMLDQIQTLAVIYPDIEFKFNGKKVLGQFKKYAKQYDDEIIIQEQDNCSIAIGRSPDGFRHLTYVNGIHTKNGGHHIECVMDEMCDVLIPAIKRKYKIEVTKARVKECITLLMFIRNMKNMRFDSQTKERLTSPAGEIKSHIQVDGKKLASSLLKSEAILMPIIEAALARKLAAEKAAETKANKKASKAKVQKHIKANEWGNDKLETTLFLTEGDSATGPFIKVRDRELQGAYPLRGKFKNTWGLKAVDVMKNAEAFDVCAITGLTIGQPAENMNYRNIAIMTDADVDGVGSIYPSLLAFFSNWPELFHEGRIRFVKTPVIIAQLKDKQEWFYSLPDYEEAKDKLPKHTIRYIKGLGSLEDAEYKRVLLEPVFEVVQLPDNWKELFEMLFGKDSQQRKDWMNATL